MTNAVRNGRSLDLAQAIRSRRNWLAWPQSGVLVPVFAGLLAALYWHIGLDLIERVWGDDNYSHALLVPFFSGFLIWQRRAGLRVVSLRGSWLGLPVLLAGVGMLLLGTIAIEDFLMRSSFVVILAGLVLWHLGPEFLRKLAFPLVFLLFAVPLPAIVFYAIAFPLQNLAAQNATWTLNFLGVPALREGNIIQLSHITLGVTEACSGIRSLLSLLCLAVAWGYLTLRSTWGIVALAVVAVPITIVANAGRVVMTGLIGQWFGIQYAQGFFHDFTGFAIFMVALACLLGIHGVIRFTRRR